MQRQDIPFRDIGIHLTLRVAHVQVRGRHATSVVRAAGARRRGRGAAFIQNKGSDDIRTRHHRTPPSNSDKVQDPFSGLAAEITIMVLDHLESKDIANLRLATPVFRQLPTILFRRLFLEDMPWLIEVKELDVASVDWYDWYCIGNLVRWIFWDCGIGRGFGEMWRR